MTMYSFDHVINSYIRADLIRQQTGIEAWKLVEMGIAGAGRSLCCMGFSSHGCIKPMYVYKVKS